MTLVLFPSQPFSPRDIDLDFEEERSAAPRRIGDGFGRPHSRV
jgi:hypothetical protein